MMARLFAAGCTGQSILPDLWGGLRKDGSCEVEINSLPQVGILIGNIVQILMVVAGLVAVGFIIVGGFMYITSTGDPAGIKKGRDTIVNAVIGLILSMVAFGVVKFITGQF